jgi:hypothetical protein
MLALPGVKSNQQENFCGIDQTQRAAARLSCYFAFARRTRTFAMTQDLTPSTNSPSTEIVLSFTVADHSYSSGMGACGGPIE